MAESIEIGGHRNEFATGEYTGTPEEAIAKFRAEHPGFEIEYVGDRTVVGACEACECLLFEDSDYHESEDGVTWCKSHDEQEEPADG